MRRFIIILIFIVSWISSFGQTSATFNLLKAYKIEGVIFPETFKLRFKIDSLVTRFTPTDNQIELGEKYLLLNQKSVIYKEMNGFFNPRNLLDKLKTYKRQYIGYVDLNKDSIVVIQLLNFQYRHQAERAFNGWQNNYILGFDGFYDENLKKLKINLSKKIVSPY